MISLDSLAHFRKTATLQRARATHRIAFAAAIGLCFAAQVPAGTVVTDGSVGARTTLTGPTYNIPASLGQQKGGNLFHSFSSFSLSKNDVASFSGPSSVTNVIARVTGGGASNIDGTVQCTIAGANFYLINPAGVVFGPDSALDVKGAFVVTTADYLKLADGSHFNATNLADTTLTSAAPSAFGFLAAKPAAISTTTANLTNASGAISIVGGDVQINGGVIQSPGGRVNLVSAASSGELTFDAASLLASIDLTPGGPTLGDVSLQQATIATSGPGGGRISVRGGSLEANGSVLVAQNTGTTPGQGIDIAVSGAAAFSPAIVSTDISGAGSAGAIAITAASVTVDGSALPGVASGISSGSSGAGQAGAIAINTGSFTLSGGSAIFTGTSASSNAGNVTINATGDVRVDATNFPGTTVSAATSGAGRGGNLAITANSLELVSGATLSTSAFGAGNAGNISISANSVSLDNAGGTLINRGLIAGSFAPGTGNAGQIAINASALSVTQGAVISANTNGSGAAGSVAVTGGTITLDEGTSTGTTGILAASLSATGGSAGSISVSGTTVQLLNGAVIFANNAGLNSAGTISVNATDLTINNNSLTTTPFGNTGIFADTSATLATAPGGQISVTANTVTLLAGGEIDADALQGGTGGTMAIAAAQSLTIDGRGGTVLTGLSAQSFSGAGNAGKITVTTAAASLLGGAFISVDNSGTGAGGTASIAASQSFTIDDQSLGAGTGIFADGTDGPAGTVKIVGGAVSLLNGAEISAGAFGAGAGGTIDINVSSMNIQGTTGETQIVASALSGNSGTINITATGALTLNGDAAIYTDTLGTGMAGTVNITGGSLTLNGGTGIASIESATNTSGNAGTVNVNISGAMQVLSGSTVNASTNGSGNGGTVNVTAATIILDKQTSTEFTGILADSTGGSAGTSFGAGGTVIINANSLIIDNNAEINGTTFGNGSGGGINVTAGSILLENGGSIISNADVLATGKAGDISIQTGTLQIDNSSQITSDTVGSGDGGNVTVKVSGALAIDGEMFHGLTVTGISAQSGPPAGAPAGTPQNTGNSGSVDVSAGSILLRNFGDIETTSVGLGAAGRVTVSANAITLQRGSTISSAAIGDGIGGDVAVTAQKLVVDGRGSSGFTGVTAQSQGVGQAGTVIVTAAKSVQVIDNGAINSLSGGAGAAGSVSIFATDLSLNNDGLINSDSHSSGAAGEVNIQLSGTLYSSHSKIAISAVQASSDQTINISAKKGIDLIDSSVNATANGAGGGITIISPATIQLQNSSVLTHSISDNGGDIFIDPSFVILQDSHLSANGGNNGGNITIHPVWLLESQSTITATGMRGVGGTLQVTPDYNLTGALLSLPTSLSDNLTLQPECAADLPGAISSFVVTGRGAAPIQPDGWSTDLELRLPTTRPK